MSKNGNFSVPHSIVNLIFRWRLIRSRRKSVSCCLDLFYSHLQSSKNLLYKEMLSDGETYTELSENEDNKIMKRIKHLRKKYQHEKGNNEKGNRLFKEICCEDIEPECQTYIIPRN